MSATFLSAALKKVADTGAPLYASLNDAQKNRFRFLARLLRPHPMMGRTEGQGWREGRGFGRGQFGPGQFGPGQFGPRGGEWRGQRFGEGGPGWGGRPPGDDRGPGFYGRMRRMMQGDDQDSRL